MYKAILCREISSLCLIHAYKHGKIRLDLQDDPERLLGSVSAYAEKVLTMVTIISRYRSFNGHASLQGYTLKVSKREEKSTKVPKAVENLLI